MRGRLAQTRAGTMLRKSTWNVRSRMRWRAREDVHERPLKTQTNETKPAWMSYFADRACSRSAVCATVPVAIARLLKESRDLLRVCAAGVRCGCALRVCAAGEGGAGSALPHLHLEVRRAQHLRGTGLDCDQPAHSPCLRRRLRLPQKPALGLGMGHHPPTLAPGAAHPAVLASNPGRQPQPGIAMLMTISPHSAVLVAAGTMAGPSRQCRGAMLIRVR
eukprot:6187498-Pleurochrysis_carterae.AAC.4